MKKTLIIGLLLVTTILISGCVSTKPTQTPQPVTIIPTVVETTQSTTETPATTIKTNMAVDIKNFMFVPATITVMKGATVTWTNDDTVPHTITSVTGLFDSGNIDPGATYSHTFTQTGSFEYSCTNHPNMPHGTVTVTP